MRTDGRLVRVLASALATVACAAAVSGCGLAAPQPSPTVAPAGTPVGTPVATPGHLPGWSHRHRSHLHGSPTPLPAPTIPREPTTSDPRAFAGYDLRLHRVTMISASWRVPAIGESSRAGAGGTWVGVQPPDADSHSEFIQVGTTDARYGGKFNDYEAFWSSTDEHFHPVKMMDVLPGEQVSATLTLVGHRWRIRFVDHTSGQTRQVFTTQETHAVLQQAEWLQEDPSIGTSQEQRRLAYAGTVPVRFAALRANGSAPQPDAVQPVTMVLPHGELGPTPLRGDAFTVRPTHDPSVLVPPPAAFTSGTTQPPATGTWNAVGTVTSSEGYADDPPGLKVSRTWVITRCPEGSGCVYSLSRTFGDGSAATTIDAPLQQTAGGWRAVWPGQQLVCQTDSSGRTDWTQHEIWLIRFTDGGTVAEAHESSYSYNPTCGYGRSTTTWNATLASGGG